MVPFSTTFPQHVRFLLNSLDGSNSDTVFRELCESADGADGSSLLLRTCFDHIDICGANLKDIHLNPAIVSLFKYLLEKPNFSTLFCQSVRSEAIKDGFLDNLSDAFCLSISEKIAIGLALLDSEKLETRSCGKSFCVSQIEGLLANPSALGSTEQIQQILMFLRQSEDLSKHVDTFIRMLNLVPWNESCPSILVPLTSNESEEASLLRNLDFMYDSENDFDAVVAEMERELSMADIMKDLGYGCTDDAKNCKHILSLLSPLTVSTISRIVGTVACTHGGILDGQNAYPVFLSATGCNPVSDLPELSSWNINILVDSIKELAPDTNWVRVMESLDYEGFYLPDEGAFNCLMSIYKLACQDHFPLHSICGKVWNNAEGQLSFLKHAVSSSGEVVNFSHSARQLELLDSVQGLKLESRLSNHAWFCLDLLDVLCQIAERGYRDSVQSILDYPLKYCPEVLLLGLAQIKTAYNLVQDQLSHSILPGVICSTSTHRNGIIVQLWRINPLLLVRSFVEALATDADNIARIVDICDEIKILNIVMTMMPFKEAIRLAVSASNKELVDLEKWLSDNLITHRDTFFEECLKYLKDIQFGTSQQERIHHSGVSLNIHSQAVAVFLKVLQANSHSLSSSHLCDEMDKLNISLRHGGLGENDGNKSSAAVTYDDDVESEANSYFQTMFSEQLSISEMVEMLSRFKDSSDKREKSIFECVINNLFEEYRFFPKYPEKQLGLAAVLFGSVIKNQLVTHITLGIAIRYVLDALRKPADSKMFGFGTMALEQFINRLDEWPQYCNHILQISHLRGTHPELVAYIEGVLTRRSHGGGGPPSDHLGMPTSDSNVNEMIGSNGGQLGQQLPTPLELQSREHISLDDGSSTPANTSNFLRPPLSSITQSIVATSSEGAGNQKSAGAAPIVSSSPGHPRQPRGITSARFGSALNIGTLLSAAERRDTPIEAPALEVQDKVSFIINNLSAANIEVKAKEFFEILKEQYFPWFAEYMVMKRASIESNFHELYLKFLEKANSKDLNKEILKVTYENCKVLLGSELIKSSSEERSLLKNLGSWLGKLTIGRNQVLRARDIDPKSLIIEAYERGLMIAVIPFTSKILEPCQSSLAYQPPNPWTMAILALLAEIYAMPNLKMNLKFDIEVLFKNLSVNMKDVAPTSLLKDRARVVEGNPDFSNKDIVVSHPPIEDKPGAMPPLPQLEMPLEVPGPSHLGHSHSIPTYGPARPLIEDEKIGFPDQLAPQGLLPSAAPQSPFSTSQLPTATSITPHIVVNPKIGAMGLHHHFHRVLPVAIERAIHEIVPGIAQRSVSIAIQTTKELVIKDYALESDESRIYNAAHLMVGSLAGSLAHVTCKEPLRGSMSSQLRSMLQGLNIANELLETAILNATNDNLDLGCAHIEKSAADKALEIIDADVAQQLALRRKQSLGSSMYDASGFAQGSISILPETLQPKPGRVSLSQQRVYEDFVRLPWQTQQASPSTNVLLTGPSPASVSLPRPFSSSSGQFNRGGFSSGLGLGPIAQPLSIASDKIDTPLPQIFSGAPSNQGRIADTVEPVQQRTDLDATIMAPSSISAIQELLPAEPSISVKDPGTPSLPLPSSSERIGTSVSESLLSTGDALDKYQMVASKLEALLANDGRESDMQSSRIRLQSVISEVPQIILRCVARDEAAVAVAQKVFKALYESSSNNLHVGAHLAILAAIRDVCKLVVKDLTSWVIYSDEERRFNRDITVGLIRRELLNLSEYNIHTAKLLDGGKNKAATEFAISLVNTLLSEEPKVLSELHSVVDALAKLASKPGFPESLQQLVEISRIPSANVNALSSINSGMDDKSRQTREKKVISQAPANRGDYNHVAVVEPESSVFHEQVSLLFAEWFQIGELPTANDAAASNFILQMHQSGLLKGDDTSDRFFRILLELSVSHCLTTQVISPQQSSQQAQPLSFLAIDIYAKLVFSILKYCPVEQGSSKLFLLPKILAVTVRFIQKDADEKKSVFNARPYFRLFINWLLDIGSLDPIHDGVNLQVLTAFANAFHSLQPLRVPAFSFAWLELVSHRTFMPKLLTGNLQRGWPYLHRLLVDLFQFMEPFLRNAELGQAIHFLYRGTLRVLLVLLHDFPEFLCDYHFSFCDVIPPSCIQMRNIVLSAFPRNMRLPDPSTPNLKIDLLAEMSQSPRILSEVDATLKAKQMKADVDEYLKTRQQQGSSFLIELKQKLLLSQNEANRTGTRYNVPLINSLVLYVGIQAIQQLQARTPSQPQSPSNNILVDAALDIFQTLIMDLDTEGRYLFLNAIANQLRYPNNHTHYFSFILLHLFSDANQEIIQEQITRVLLERLIVNRPHPWGLLITFIELIKNPRYSFWNRSFTRCAPEIEKLFESVSRSCGGPKPVNEGMVGSGALSENAH